MNKSIFALSFLFALNSFAATPKPELRLIETTPQLAQLFQDQFKQVQSLGQQNGMAGFNADPRVTTLLVPKEIIPALSGLSHDKNGKCGGFIDITDENPLSRERAKTTLRMRDEKYPQLGSKRRDIVEALSKIKSANVESFVKKYSASFSTRLASSAEGVAAPKWLAAQWKDMAVKAGREDILVDLIYPPRGYDQQNVRVTIPGSDPNLAIVVIGGHLDSINHKDGKLAPGIDDNGSGISALTEAYRVMLESGFRPKATVQIMGYAAEELGLYGSRAVAQQYSDQNVKVRAVMQLDMVAYPGTTKALTFIDDHTSDELTQWTEQLFGLYVGGPVLHDRCGYACSDHASWTRYGYASVFPFEAPDSNMNPNLHSTKDIWDMNTNAEFAAQFSKLAYAFTAVLSQE